MADLVSPAFSLLPQPQILAAALEEAGLGTVTSLNMLPFSSCTPAVQIGYTSPSGVSRVAVVRGEQQNDLLVTPRQAAELEKEVWALRTLSHHGVPTPALLLDGQILRVPAVDRETGEQRDFRFFVMDFLPGVAVDRAYGAASQEPRLQLLDRIAAIYAGVHAVTGPAFGFADRQGQPVNGIPEFSAYISSCLFSKADLLERVGERELAAETRAYAAGWVADVVARLPSVQARLVLYDGSAGNMLVDGHSVAVIDQALCGWFPAWSEFGPVVFAFRRLLTEKLGEISGWDWLLDRYAAHGGELPQGSLLYDALAITMTDLILHNIIYGRTHRDLRKREKVGGLVALARRLMAGRPAGYDDLVAIVEG